MGKIILFMLISVMGYSQVVNVNNIEYVLMGDLLDNPSTYVYDFMNTARERGHDFFDREGTVGFFEGTGSTKGYSIRSFACDGGYFIGLQRAHWDNFNPLVSVITGSTNLYEQRRHLVFHELGHALLKLRHVCHKSEGIKIIHDIMFSPTACSSGYSFSHQYDWENSVDRMFNPDYQETYSCGTGKGNIIDY